MIAYRIRFHRLYDDKVLYGDFELNNITDTYVNFSVKTLINSLTKEELKLLSQRINLRLNECD